jgi:hypothetical protein
MKVRSAAKRNGESVAAYLAKWLAAQKSGSSEMPRNGENGVS